MHIKVKENLAQFLYNNGLVSAGTNLFYAEGIEVDNNGIETIRVEQNIFPNLGIVSINACPQFKFIVGIDAEILP